VSFWDEPPGSQRVRMVVRTDDADGRFVDDSVSPPVGGCSIQGRPPSESHSTGQQYRVPYTVYGPPELGALRAQDAVDLELEPGSDRWIRATLVGPARVWPESPHNVQLTAEHSAG